LRGATYRGNRTIAREVAATRSSAIRSAARTCMFPPDNLSEGTMIRRRSMVIQIVLMVVTFGIYSIYWFYSVNDELRDSSGDREASPAL
jgi:hypothetical protein